MFETTITLKPESEWRPGHDVDKLIAEMDEALAVPRRLECLDHADQGPHRHAGHRDPTPVGVKVIGTRPDGHGEVARRDRDRDHDRARHRERLSPSASIGGYYLEIEPDRDAARPLRLMVDDVQKADRAGARRRDR